MVANMNLGKAVPLGLTVFLAFRKSPLLREEASATSGPRRNMEPTGPCFVGRIP